MARSTSKFYALRRSCLVPKNITTCQLKTATLYSPASTRPFHISRPTTAHGVFEGLTESRITTPWIVAFGNQKNETIIGKKSIVERDRKPKKMSDTFHSAILPLAQDKWLGDSYINASGHIRVGTILMDLDALAGIIAYKHTGEGVTVVTAACDRITIENPLSEISDLEYSGQVTYATGRSSMEITCKVARKAEGREERKEDVLLTCMFTMVALDPKTRRATNIPPLKIDTLEEQKLFDLGESRSKHKKSLALQGLLNQPPNAAESALIHNMWLLQVRSHDPNDPMRLSPTIQTMSSTRLHNSQIMQPQYRNLHNFTIFGGFLMKQTFELAFCCAASFARARPSFVSLDPSTFREPVPVGSVLYLTATVTYTDPPLAEEAAEGSAHLADNLEHGKDEAQANQRTRVQIRVDSKVRNVEHGTTKPTGQFNYTFTVDKDVRVMPQTYQEYMMYLDSRRRAKQADVDVGKGEGVATMGGDGGSVLE